MFWDSQWHIKFPFDQYSLIESGDPDVLQHAVSSQIDPHRFSYASPYHPSKGKITCVRLRKTHLFGVCFGANLHASTPPAKSFQFVTPLQGNVTSHIGKNSISAEPGVGLVLLPGTPVEIDWGGNCVAVVTSVDCNVLSEMAKCVFGTNAGLKGVVPRRVDLKTGAGCSVANVLRSIMVELNDENTLFSTGAITKEIEEILLTSILYAVSEPVASNPVACRGQRFGPVVRRALDYIYANLGSEIMVSDITAATGVSLRKLQYEFARTFDAGPMTVIRREKLKRARDMLENSLPGEATVGDVAAHWGFFDRRYFTKLYLSEFNELPSATLKRQFRLRS